MHVLGKMISTRQTLINGLHFSQGQSFNKLAFTAHTDAFTVA
jgi:hypothetical protein